MSIEELNVEISRLRELHKKIACKRLIMNLFAFILTAIIVVLTINKLSNEFIELVIMVVVVEIAVCLIVFELIISQFVKKDDKDYDCGIEKVYYEFKRSCVLNSLKSIFSDVAYNPSKGFSKEFIKNVGMLYTGDSFESNDYVSGKYKNISFEQSDIHIQKVHEEKDSDGNVEKVWETTFLGRVMVFDFNKKFKANLQVSSYLFDSATLPWSKKFSKVRMEDVEFNKNFNVYAEDEHEAFYLLTPQFMEKIKDVTRKLKCGVMFCFVDNKLHIAVDNSSDSFECNIFKPIDEKKITEEISRDIKLITDFVDELNLDNDLFV